MELLQGVQYFYTSNGQQTGPVDGTQLIALAQGGQVTAADHIWAEGFTEWVPVPSVDQLAPLFQTKPSPPVPPAGLPPAASSVPPPPTGYRPKPAARPSPQKKSGSQSVVKKHLRVKAAHRFREGASFGRLVMLLVLGILLGAGAGYGLLAVPETPPDESLGLPNQVMPAWALFLLSAGSLICLGLYGILSLVYLFRAWAYIQEIPVARTTPGKAVWFLFLPLFNYYWLFIAYVGWANDYNDYLEEAEAYEAPRGNPGLAMTHCILALLGIPFLHIFVMHNMCQAINYLATSPKPEAAE